MNYIQNSQDVLNVAKTIAVIGLSFLLGWFIYYMVMIMRQLFKVVKEMRDRVNKVDEVIKSLKEKIEHSTSYLLLISEGVKKLVDVYKSHGEKEGKNKKKK